MYPNWKWEKVFQSQIFPLPSEPESPITITMLLKSISCAVRKWEGHRPGVTAP